MNPQPVDIIAYLPKKALNKVLLFGLLLFVFTAVFSGSAHAETNTAIASSAPTPNSGTTDTGSDFTPITGVGRGQFDGRYMWYKVYVRNGQTTTINVNQTCADSFGSPTVDYQVESLGATELDYQAPFGNIYPVTPKVSSDCTKTVSFSINASTYGIASTIKGHEGFHVFALFAQIEAGPGSAEQYFTVTSTNTANTYIGMAKPDFTNKLLKYSTVYKTSGTWSYSVMFAPRCGQSVSNPVSIQIYDPDNGIYQNNMRAYLEQSPSPGTINWSTQKSWTAAQVQGGSFGVSGTTSTLSFTADNDHIYKFHVLDSSHPNTIQIKLPFDQFDAIGTVRDACGGGPIISCSITPVSQTVAQNNTATINITAKSDQSWKSTYYIKRTGPSYRNITTEDSTSATGATYHDSVIYTGTNQVTYRYVVWDSATDNQVSTSGCSQDITWVPPGGISCTAKPADPNPFTGSGDTITVTLYNNSSSNLQGGQLRQTSPGGGAWPLSGFGNFSQGQQASHDYTINSRDTPQTVTFQYTLFTGTNAGDPVFPGTSSPLCTTTITWKQAGLPSVSVSCSQINVTSGISSATYQPLAYLKNRNNINLASAHVKSDGQVAVFIDPGGGGGGGGGGGTLPPPPATITKIPIKLEITGNGIDQIVYGWVGNTATGNNQAYQNGTFTTFSQAWPHLTGGYTIALSYVASGASQANVDDGNFYPDEVWADAGSTQINGGQSCLDAFCGQPSSVDSEPGQRQNFSYGIHVNNSTDKTFSASDSNGYSFGVNVGGGLHDVNYQGPSNDISPGNPTNININFDARVDWSGSFGITMYFRGSPLTLANLPGAGCGDASVGQSGPPGGATPASRPFFEVRGTDARAGGGYKSVIGSCGSAGDPPYVSPTSAKNDIEGGIRSFAFNSGGTIYGSRGEFGADVLGVIFQGQNYGFYAGATFANQDQPSNSMGGFLNNDSGGIYTAHCLDDYYTNTRLTQSPAGFGGGDIGAQASGQYQAPGGISLSGTNISHGKQITLYVDGDVTINGDITYDNTWNAADQKDVPFLAIIVRGNIYVAPGVTKLDGLYIAQPDTSGGGGVFNTCTPGSFCNQQLVVNGAVIAQGVQLLRAHGTVGPLEADLNSLTTNPAEVFNFVPSMVMGLPYWQNVDRGGAVVPNDIEALFSLPPVF